MKTIVLKENSKKKVKIEKDKYGTYLSATRNGYQWSSIPIDNEMLEMIEDVVLLYLRYSKTD